MEAITKLDYKERVFKLRENLFLPAGHTELGEISIERARSITGFHQDNEGLPAELKRAGALERILEEISIYILDGELIVGNNASKPTSVEVFPEYGVNWLLDELDNLPTREADKYTITDGNKEELRTILTWWKGRTVEERIRCILGEEEYWYKDRLVFHSTAGNCTGQNSICPDYPKILGEGLNGIISEVEDKLKGLDLNHAENLEKSVFYRAVIISLKAVIKFAKRYAELAKEMARDESNPYRKKELEKIAEACERVPANPARSFHEAIQAFWFIHAVLCLEAGCVTFTPGRMDQWLYPYYRKDIDAGKLSKDDAQELLECLWIKFNESLLLLPATNAVYYSGQPLDQDVTISGVDENGLDATNELSYMMLDCEKHLMLRQPEFLLPVHKDTPEDLLKSACGLVKEGGGKPKFVSLETLQAMRMADPFPYTLKELRNIVWTGCGENTIPGVERSGDDTTWYTGLPLALELALNKGKSRLAGEEQWGLETGDPRSFKSFEEVMEAFRKQVAYAIRHRCVHSDAMIMAQSQLTPSPLRSAFIYDCIGRGLDIYKGGAKYNFDVGADVGITTCGDCLAAMKKVVFEDKKLTMSELIDVLDANFEGKEEIRQMLLGAPKFGNDDDYVDLITREIARFASLEHRKHPHIHGGMHRSSHTTVTAGLAIGRMVGATPDGRKSGEPLNDGGLSPHQGRDKKGPTAVMKSVSKIDWQAAYGGVMNLRFTTDALKGDEGIVRLMALIRAYHDMGGFHVQFNCVDLKTLRDAQEHPEKYPDLLIRVGAYSAYFVQLSRPLQEDIISRTEHTMCC